MPCEPVERQAISVVQICTAPLDNFIPGWAVGEWRLNLFVQIAFNRRPLTMIVKIVEPIFVSNARDGLALGHNVIAMGLKCHNLLVIIEACEAPQVKLRHIVMLFRLAYGHSTSPLKTVLS